MSNFDLASLALKSAFPTNSIITDDKGLPSVMVYIPKFRLCDVLSTSDTSIHPAFRVNGAEIDGFYVGKYQTHHYNGRAYSLPAEDPSVSAGMDTFVEANRKKGSRYHEITAAEWAAIALWCHKNGFEPKGNNTFGRDYNETVYKAIPTKYDGNGKICRVATGTGPSTWSHDGTLSGIWDLNGNVWEWCTGLRLFMGELQIIADNNAASPICDFSKYSADWKAINAADGSLVTPDGKGTTPGTVKMSFDGSKWTYSTTITGKKGVYGCNFEDVVADDTIGYAAKLILQSLAMLPDKILAGPGIDPHYGMDYIYIDNSNPDRCLIRGGYWQNNESAGLFYSRLNFARTSANNFNGGRSAYID